MDRTAQAGFDVMPTAAASPRQLRTSSQRRAFTLLEVLIVLAVLGVVLALFLPQVHRGREPARRTQCRNNLKGLGLALHHYHDVYGALPPVYTVDANGQPLHSWRTLLLPYLGHEELYNRLDLSKSWNDPVNSDAFESFVPAYHCASSLQPRPKTTYLAIRTDSSVWQTSGDVTLKDITDGTSNTLLVVEVPEEYAVPWMEPRDADDAAALAFLKADKLVHTGGVHALIADGSVRFLSANLQADTLRALITKDGGETVSNDW